MKRMKKAFALMLAMVMAMAMAVPSFADDDSSTIPPGSITIDGVHTDSHGDPHTEYKVYKLLDLDHFDPTLEAYIYKLPEGSPWEGFFNDPQTGGKYISVDSNRVARWSYSTSTQDDWNAFASAALAYAKSNPSTITADMSSATRVPDGTPDNEKVGFELKYNTTYWTGKFYGLPLGYYLIESNVGVLCGLTTTQPNGTIQAKNVAPSVDKKVQENSEVDTTIPNGDIATGWESSNDASIGDTVKFRSIINAQNGAENYVFHDSMDAGFTYNEVSTVLLMDNSTPTELIEGTDYFVCSADALCSACISTASHDNYDHSADCEHTTHPLECTFHVVFTPERCAQLKSGQKLYIYYNATLNEKALIHGSSNANNAWMSYGDTHHTTKAQTQTHTYGFEVVKTDSTSRLLNGATFALYAEEPTSKDASGNPLNSTGTQLSPIPLVLVSGDGSDGNPYLYRKALPTGEPETTTTTITVNGTAKVVGFDEGTYYLLEIDPPAGYNKLETPTQVKITGGNLYATFTDGSYSSGGVRIMNSKGDILPTTGGMGTVMFITCGSIVVMAAGVLLVTKKRMSMIQD